jgi:hypothetical protein
MLRLYKSAGRVPQSAGTVTEMLRLYKNAGTAPQSAGTVTEMLRQYIKVLGQYLKCWDSN